MIQPVLAVLVASSIHLAADFPRPVDLTQIAISITQAIQTGRAPRASAAPVLTVRDIPFYYDPLVPVPVPEAAPVVTYDWRSPVIFDLP